ncbi:MAG: preprotein translocase subunit SecA [Spirochaetaceae bacterium]|jgi:preprotein translocase subunit SecA|nr:preprotein translocase subunit SecA [Spirochaetaceae bacterium]
MFEKIWTAIFGSQHERDLKALQPILKSVNEKDEWARALSDADFPKETERFKALYKEETDKGTSEQAALNKLLPEAFALAREAARRVLGERPYDVQVMGSIVLHQGKIAELKTGEGKTLMVVAAAYLNSISGKGVHVVTVNDYLAGRDAGWMGPIYNFLGLSVGTILNDMDNDRRKQNYACDITYGTNNEFGFDYLRDNMRWDIEGRVQRGHHYCIVDEIDSILIDEARTPLIISGAAEDDTFKFAEVDRMLGSFEEVKKKDNGEYPDETQGEEVIGDYKINEKNKSIQWTAAGQTKMEQLLQKRGLIKGQIVDDENFEYLHYFTQAMRAHKLFHIDVDYVVQDGAVQIVDEFTGRILYGRRYSDGLHQAIEAKERIKIAQRNRTLATITFQNYFRLYEKLAGMTGTADTEATEFAKIYNLEVVVVPTNVQVTRIDEDDVVYLNEADKFKALCDEIETAHKKGQPILVGTVSIEKSEQVSALLTRRGVRHEVLNAKNHAREALIIAEAGSKGAVTIATNMAGRGTDIKLGGNPEFRARKKVGTEANSGKPEYEAQYQTALKAEKEAWKKDYEEVKSLGGLYVIGTERHESRRIDNQLRGRSGRQGDPGRSKFFISMDDDLMRLFGGDRIKSMMGRIGMEPGEPIYHPWLNKSIEKAQTRVEERNFEIRKHLLEYDDVLNQQRKYIYQQRDDILSDDNLTQRVEEASEDMVDDVFEQYDKDSHHNPDAAYGELAEYLRTHLGYHLLEGRPSKEAVKAALQKDVADKAALVGNAYLNQIIRLQYLRNIDQKWLDHLENMEALREAVYLRGYAQKNPLTEYKIEGFEIFDTMIDTIREEIASRVHLARIQLASEANPQSRSGLVQSMSTSHGSMGAFAGSEGGNSNTSSGVARNANSSSRGGPLAQSQPQSATVVRSYPKVGRNDPCPCGSGKKYKYCHGR